MGSPTFKYLAFLLWVAGVYLTGLHLYTTGFLLRRNVLPHRTCVNKTGGCTTAPRIFDKAVIILIDALKYDFGVYNSSLGGAAKHYQNKLPILKKLAQPDPSSGLVHGKLFKFLADPPTTTMQRLKGLTTGSLPTFIDVSNNFGSYSVEEDNIIDQLVGNGKRVAFMGDDTWTSLYPDRFSRSVPFSSFDVWDLDSVDLGVQKELGKELSHPQDWDVLIGHFLGVDHAGHKFGPNHPEMGRKLTEMNAMIERTARTMPDDCLLLVFGDHGMTDSGDHGGDSSNEINAALFAYSLKLGMSSSSVPPAVSQIDLVPTLALLMGVPVPFSNLGGMIEDLFIPTSLAPGRPGGQHIRSGGYSYEDLVKFRLSYMRSNVEQVNRYLNTYTGEGGSFPKKTNKEVRELASQVISQRAGALSPRQTVDLYNACKSFLRESKQMCQSVWVDFNIQSMTVGLNLLFLHTCILLLLVLKPPSRPLSTLISGSLLLYLGASLLVGAFTSVTVSLITPISLSFVLPATMAFFSILAQGFSLLWKLRQSLLPMFHCILLTFNAHNILAALILISSLSTVFSNSFVVLESHILNFLAVSLILSYLMSYRTSSSRFLPLIAIFASAGLLRLALLYVRCREEQGPDCPTTQFHKPLATLSADVSKDFKNWRFFFTILSVGLLISPLQLWLTALGNKNGISVPVLTASYAPWLAALLLVGFWALQSFPSSLVSRLLPWQQNFLAQCVYGLCICSAALLTANPRLVYLLARKPGASQMLHPRHTNLPAYFKYIKANWRTTLTDRSLHSAPPLVYGLGTGISAVLATLVCLAGLISMLLLGDGQSPAVFLQVSVMSLVLLLTSPPRLTAASTISSLLSVPWHTTLLWSLMDSLSFYTTGHQPTFPHIQWNAAFVGFMGRDYGSSLSSNILPFVLITWNTYCGSILSGLALPLLVLAPAALWYARPGMRPQGKEEKDMWGTMEEELQRGEAVLLERVEESRGAVLILCCQYLVLRAARLIAAVVAATILRRHLMVWKIFAPRFIFEAGGFLVTLVSVIVGYCCFTRTLVSLAAWYSKINKS